MGDSLFAIDTSGDREVERELKREASLNATRAKGASSASSAQKRKRLLAQEKQLASLVFELEAPPTAAELAEEDGAQAVASEDEDGNDDDDEIDYEQEQEEKAAAADANAAGAGPLGASGWAHDGEGQGDDDDEPAAWVDEDDEQQTIDVSGSGRGASRLKKLRKARGQSALGGAEYVDGLRKQFQSVHGDVSWALLPSAKSCKKPKQRKGAKEGGGGGGGSGQSGDVHGDDDDDDDEEEEEFEDTDGVLRSSGPLLGGSSALPAGLLSVRRLVDLNLVERNASVTSTVQWHPNGKLALTAGLDKTLRLFRADGAENPKLQAVHLPRTPIASAAFSADGSQVLMCGKGKQWCARACERVHALLRPVSLGACVRRVLRTAPQCSVRPAARAQQRTQQLAKDVKLSPLPDPSRGEQRIKTLVLRHSIAREARLPWPKLCSAGATSLVPKTDVLSLAPAPLPPPPLPPMVCPHCLPPRPRCPPPRRAVFDLHSGSVRTLPGLHGRSEHGFTHIVPSPAADVLAMVSESGAVHLLSAASKQLVATLQPGGGGGRFATQCLQFSPDGRFLHVASEGSTVRVWDVRRRCCVHAWQDRGGLRTTSLATSPDGELIAAGADSGAVNIYRTAEALSSARPPPLKELLNLTSAVTTLAFNPTSECLAFASRYGKRAMRVAHVGSRSAFSNWPTAKSPLNYVQCAAFSPSSAHMAIGTDQGKVLLYQLNHYASSGG